MPAPTPATGERRPGVPQKAPQVYALTLSPVTVRGSSESISIVVPAGSDVVAIRLESDAESRRLVARRASIRIVGGDTVWEGSVAAEANPPVGTVARVDVPAARLRADDYLVTLFGTDQAGVEREWTQDRLARAGSMKVRRLAVLVCLGLVLTAPAPRAAMQRAGRTPPATALPGGDIEQPLAAGESHEWLIDLAGAEFVQITVEPVAMGQSDEWPAVTVTAPDGATVHDSVEPSVIPGIDDGGRTVVSFVGALAGSYRLRLAGRSPGPSPTRFRVRLNEQRPAVDEDRRRLAAHRLWREGGRLILQGSSASLRGSAERYKEARAILAGLQDDEGEAMTLGTIAKIRTTFRTPRGGMPPARARWTSGDA